ncbi:hypothetical protein [Glycomyces xiaoerkulensis]|uniref:hypothetical protein n=1 Tax=Glycomyces xiaoerkulensis TaxID=2038139 RepID=UPI000C2666A0|nr:hypothetical protein [Glycomyces xiaoerkulensis]
MVGVSLRENRLGATEQNAVERHAHRPGQRPEHRHRPGDTWQIGGRQHDPHDPGPYGTSHWRQDHRTGRHRRGELPDPLPPEPRPAPRPRRYWEPSAPADDDYLGWDREDAWEAWIRDSEPLARAHHTAAERECGRQIALLIRLIRWILAVIAFHRASRVPEEAAQPGISEPHHETRAPGRTAHCVTGWEDHFDMLHATTVIGGGLR